LGDIAGFMQGYWKSPQTSYVGAHGLERGWQALLDRYWRAYCDRAAMGTVTFSHLEIRLLGRGAALNVGRWQLVRAHDRPGGVEVGIRPHVAGLVVFNAAQDTTNIVALRIVQPGQD
jgi:hypothetical protein